MKPSAKYIILFLLVAALLPYFIICFHALPFADDFCFAWTASEQISFAQKFLNQYLKWNGRYTADMLVNLHPLITGRILIYQLVLFFSLLATPFCLYYFLKTLVFNYQLSVINYHSLIASLLITLFYFCYQPNLTEGVYWYIGIVNYHLGNLCLLLQILFLLKSFSAIGNTKIILQLFSFPLLVAAVGFNEVGAVIIPTGYLLAVMFSNKEQTENNKQLLLHFAIALITSAFVFFSPGNFIRLNEFPQSHQLFHSLLYASLQTIRFIAKWIFSIPFILISILIISNADKLPSKFKQKFDYRVIIFFLLFTIFSGSFLPYFATGTLGQHRTINYVFFYFILLWILLLISISKKFSVSKKLSLLKSETRIAGVVIASIVVMMLTENGFNIILDFREDNFAKYETEFFGRQEKIIQHPENIFPLKNVPHVFTITDAKNDSTFFAAKCMRKFYTEIKIELK